FLRCRSCGAVSYMERPRCPACGGTELAAELASGRGRLRARTTVHRAPSAEYRPHVPYTLALVAAEEGFTLMALLSGDAAIGEEVEASFVAFAGRIAPIFARQTG